MDGFNDNTADGEVPVWDPVVRLFHWALVAEFTIAYLTAEEWDLVHEIAGYGVATLVVIRVLWGFWGSEHARFSDFIYRPSKIVTFVRESLQFKARRYLGHNPAGGAMVLALIGVMIGLSITGIMLTMEAYHDAEWLEEIHELLANGALVLIALHIVGVILASFEHRENLVKSMITGRKRAKTEHD